MAQDKLLNVAFQLSTISVRLLQTLEKFRNEQIKKVKVRHAHHAVVNIAA
jgi:hypothetical protein